MRLLAIVCGLLLLGSLLYLTISPAPIAPVAWQPQPAPGFTGAFASNGKLAGIEIIMPELPGPEALLADDRGRLTTGLLDGRIIRLNPERMRFKLLGNTGGRPLGMKLTNEGSLIVADAEKGLLELPADGGAIKVLAASYKGRRLRMADDLDLLPDGRIVFTDASTRFGLGEFELDLLEHSDTGRLFIFDPVTKKLSVLRDGLAFANGIATSRDGLSVLVCETSAYRVRRVFVSGPRMGQSEVVIDNLPGFPDNISYDRERDLFWLALAAPREKALDLLAPYPFVRGMVARLPKALRMKANPHGLVVALRDNGKVVKFLDDPRPTAFAPITSIARVGDTLYFGSYKHSGIGRLKGAAR